MNIPVDKMPDEQPPLPCAGKLVFNTQKEAEATANVSQYRYGTRLKAYVCRHCGLWHLSSNYDN